MASKQYVPCVGVRWSNENQTPDVLRGLRCSHIYICTVRMRVSARVGVSAQGCGKKAGSK